MPKVVHSFPRLSRAPIVEAVIHWQTSSTADLDLTAAKSLLAVNLPMYECQQTTEYDTHLMQDPSGLGISHQRKEVLRLSREGDDHRNIAQFKQDGVVFSRVGVYSNWEIFQNDALQVWDSFHEIASPSIVERLGVRFINQINLLPKETPPTYLKNSPKSPQAVPIKSARFLHQDLFELEDRPYHVNMVIAAQTLPPDRRVLAIDIDVSARSLDGKNSDEIRDRLQEMRQIKNALFFDCLKQSALKRLGG